MMSLSYHQVKWKQKNCEFCMYNIFVYLYIFLLDNVNVYITTDSDLCVDCPEELSAAW